ncbi:hypothetical protein [Candidatus Nitrosotalea sp. TS]|uniref:hypothetical protein n=1 Tax=Candidatus Nitrosotalea sp. TS TaxID=2341020 RepID=UPI00140C9D9E|nr:hypothetical protein [Candidatus Nitrosotalea sp. TS]
MSEDEEKEVDDEEVEEEDEETMMRTFQAFLHVRKSMIRRNFTIGIKTASLPRRMASG